MALRVAGENGQDKVITALIEQGANVNSKSHSGRYSALHHAAHKGHEKAVIALLKADVNTENLNKALYFAILKSYGRIVRALLNKGADANTVVNKNSWLAHYGWRAIHVAAEEGNKNIIRTLLDKGADVNAIIPGGIILNAHSKYKYRIYTALDIANYRGYKNITDFLLEKVANNRVNRWYLFIFLLLFVIGLFYKPKL